MVVKSKKNTKRIRTLKQQTKRGGGNNGNNEEPPPPPYKEHKSHRKNTVKMTLPKTIDAAISHYRQKLPAHYNQRLQNNMSGMNRKAYSDKYHTHKTHSNPNVVNNVSKGYFPYYSRTGETKKLHEESKSFNDYKAFLNTQSKKKKP
jgi:hypothetical protein